MRINTTMLRTRHVHEATGTHNGMPIDIQAITDTSGKIKRVYLKSPMSTAKFITKPNGFPKSVFLSFESPSGSFISEGGLQNQQVSASLLEHNGTDSPSEQLVHQMTDGHFRMYNNVMMPFARQLIQQYQSQGN